MLYFLTQAFRARLIKQLPEDRRALSGDVQTFVHRAKALLKDLAQISLEMARLVVAPAEAGTEDAALPGWFLVEVIRDLPRLATQGNG